MRSLLSKCIEAARALPPSTGPEPSMTKFYTLERIVTEAADSLIEVHEATGINLYNAPPWLNLVRSVYPEWDSEKTGH